MYLYHNIDSNAILNIERMHVRESVIQQFKKRFSTYGYREISTSVFEKYNLYATMNSTVNHLEMIKTIDNTGQVLVLRPDVTIPLTKEVAAKEAKLTENLRYFYVLDVYRQAHETHDYYERTQAGVEYFGNPSKEADAEIIALAAHLLKDLQISNFKIELGHAGFFKQLVSDITVAHEDLERLKQLIQAKNIPEINRLLEKLALSDAEKEIIATLPFLYGTLKDVLAKTKQLPLSANLTQIVNNIASIYEILQAYGVAEHITIDLSLINHMNYYSDIIFQGFIESVGKPILMGGRYDRLANQFDADFPAIGFAYDIDLLLSGLNVSTLKRLDPIDFALVYEKELEIEAIRLAQQLRSSGYNVVTYSANEQQEQIPKTNGTIIMSQANNRLHVNGNERIFHTNEHLLEIVKNIWEE